MNTTTTHRRTLQDEYDYAIRSARYYLSLARDGSRTWIRLAKAAAAAVRDCLARAGAIGWKPGHGAGAPDFDAPYTTPRYWGGRSMVPAGLPM